MATKQPERSIHVGINAWFWPRPDTGSGQYIRHLVEGLTSLVAPPRITLVAPQGWEIDAPAGVGIERIAPRGKGHLAKLRFEQVDFPRAAVRAGANLIHVPYWGAPLQSPVPVVVTIHDLIPMILPAYRGGVLARLYTGLVVASARGASAVITDSGASREDIRRHLGIASERLHAIALAVGAAYHPHRDKRGDENVRQKYKLPPEYVLYLGGYDVRKNVEALLRAFCYVRQGYDIRLVLAGRLPESITPRFSDVRGAIQAMGLEEAVQVIDWVDEADKPALYRMASVFVFPSLYEGFGLPILEAMACGTPVVSVTRSSIPEVVGEAGFLVEPDDARHMAGSILAILTEKELADELRQRGVARAAQFSWGETAEKTLDVYHQALRGG